jgi:farnesyl-diphosphate farnesyltransferase
MLPLQIEQFIETLFPRQDSKKLTKEAQEKQRQEPTMSTGETAILIAVVLGVLLTMTGVMVRYYLFYSSEFDSKTVRSNIIQVGIAWFLGARFDGTFTDTAKLWSGATGGAPPVLDRDEL